MTNALRLMSKLPRLSEEQQREVLEYAEKFASVTAQPLLDPHGLCADLRTNLAWEEFQRNRQEMWGETSDTEL